LPLPSLAFEPFVATFWYSAMISSIHSFSPIALFVSFSVVCAVLYALAYKPILKMLAARREQIATGLANAQKIKAELARIEVERREVLMKADAEGRQLIEDARAGAARRSTRTTSPPTPGIPSA
jgi:F0F1-type ATP synthase membrane subunit b/b'